MNTVSGESILMRCSGEKEKKRKKVTVLAIGCATEQLWLMRLEIRWRELMREAGSQTRTDNQN